MAVPIIGQTGRAARVMGAVKRSRAYRAVAPRTRKAAGYVGGKAKAGYKAATKTRTRKIISGGVLGAGAAGGGYAAYRKRKRSRARKAR